MYKNDGIQDVQRWEGPRLSDVRVVLVVEWLVRKQGARTMLSVWWKQAPPHDDVTALFDQAERHLPPVHARTTSFLLSLIYLLPFTLLSSLFFIPRPFTTNHSFVELN